jgi:methanogenic corrinoid protein MtbC1
VKREIFGSRDIQEEECPMKDTAVLEHIEKAIQKRDQSLLEEAFLEAEHSGLGMDHVLKALTTGLDSVRVQLKNHSASIPEFLLTVDVLKQGLKKLEAIKPKDQTPRETERIVIGVVEGDVHDLGKNIIAGVLEACGYKVLDMGRDVQARLFIEEVKRARAPILALSCMMSTPLENMREVIAWSRRDLPHTAILVGGAALDEQIAAACGADGYAASAVTVPEEAKRILAGRT